MFFRYLLQLWKFLLIKWGLQEMKMVENIMNVHLVKTGVWKYCIYHTIWKGISWAQQLFCIKKNGLAEVPIDSVKDRRACLLCGQ